MSETKPKKEKIDLEKENCDRCIWWGGYTYGAETQWCRLNGGDISGETCRMFISLEEERIKKLYG